MDELTRKLFYGDDQVVLDVSQNEIEEAIGYIENLRDQLTKHIRSVNDPGYSKKEREKEEQELRDVMKTAITCMQMIWINMEEGSDIRTFDENGSREVIRVHRESRKNEN